MFLGAHVLILEKVIIFHTVTKAFIIAGIGAIISGAIGYYIGKIIETPAKESFFNETSFGETDSDLLIDDVMLNDLKNINDTSE